VDLGAIGRASTLPREVLPLRQFFIYEKKADLC